MFYRSGAADAPRIPVGPRGQATVTAFQDSLLKLLDTHTWGSITVKAVGALTGHSPGSVYQYYRSLEELTLDTAERLEGENKPLPEHLALVVALLRFESKDGVS